MIESNLIKLLKDSKNLLAFSGGVDSTALFFILQQNSIPFDIAIVDYNLREQSKEEIDYAKELATKFNKRVYISSAPKYNNNFEAKARAFRYSFFEAIIAEKGYNNLLTAHQLDDKLEWLLMRLSKGAGVLTLSGMQKIQKREEYNIIRPLINTTKDELLKYLDTNKIKYFVDKSNFNIKYERNQFRPIAKDLLKYGKEGFNRSFELLLNEANIIKRGFNLKFKEKELRVIELKSKEYAPYALNFYLKELNYLISYNEQILILKQNSIVVGRKWAVEIVDNILYIAPFIKIPIPKKIRENYRKLKIPPKIRGYIFSNKISLK